MTAERSRAQQLVGDIAPKLAELTDEVLFGYTDYHSNTVSIGLRGQL